MIRLEERSILAGIIVKALPNSPTVNMWAFFLVFCRIYIAKIKMLESQLEGRKMVE